VTYDGVASGQVHTSHVLDVSDGTRVIIQHHHSVCSCLRLKPKQTEWCVIWLVFILALLEDYACADFCGP